MKRWPVKPLSEVLEVSRERIEPIEHPDILYNYIGLESIEGHTGQLLPHQLTIGAEIKSTKNVFHRGEILYGKLRPYLNKIYLADKDGICSTDIFVLRPKQSAMNASFAANYLRSPAVLSAASNAMAGANLPRIGQKALLGIPIPVPPVVEQERIVKLLDEADELRKLRAKADRRTAALIPALFHQMFGDPASNPKDWPLVTLGEIGGGGQYGLNAAAMTEGHGVRFIRITDIDEYGRLGRCEPAFVPVDKSNLSDYELSDGDILIARSGATAGKAYIHIGIRERCVFAGYLIRFKINQILSLPVFVFAFLQTAAYWSQLNRLKRAVAQPNVNAKQMASLGFPLPPLPLQKEFAQRVTEIRGIEAEQAASRSRLDALFQSMLYRAFNGDL
ncbi:MAG: restriction endonuclease subunit S [Candidatus Aminicenantales bacterium]